jgi:glutamate synthase (ferredoxin)
MGQAINPYLVNEIIREQVASDTSLILILTMPLRTTIAIAKGILKIMNKIGISTLHLRAAQILRF